MHDPIANVTIFYQGGAEPPVPYTPYTLRRQFVAGYGRRLCPALAYSHSEQAAVNTR